VLNLLNKHGIFLKVLHHFANC